MSKVVTAGRINSSLQGAAFMVCGMAILGLTDNFIVYIAHEAGLWQFLLMRSLMACGLMALGALILGWCLRPRRWPGVIIRSLCAAFSMVIYFGALAYVPIAQAAAGMFTAPIFVLIFSVLLFGRNISLIRILAAICGFAGVLMVLQPNPGALQVFAILPVFAGLTWGFVALATRYLCEGEDTVTLLFAFFATLGILGAVGLLVTGFGFGGSRGFFGRGWVTPGYDLWFWITVHTLGALVGLWCITRAYRAGDPSYVAPFEYSFPIFATCWAWIMFGDLPGPLGWAGFALIILGGMTIALCRRDDV